MTVIDAVVDRCQVVETGARTIDHIIAGNLLPRLSAMVLEHLAADTLPERINLDWGEDGFEIH